MEAAARAALADAGLRPGRLLGAGMEGVVLELDDDTVVKVWHHRPPAELERLRAFTDALAVPGLATPRVERVLTLGSRTATLERRLPGRPLVAGEGGAVEAVVAVLAALREAPVSPALRSLPLLPDESPLPTATSFEHGLADLVLRRAPGPLATAVPDLDHVVARVVDRLRSRPPAPPRLLHGDLIPANVHVDEAGRPVAVLDFGFLTTTGDPAFDAAVAASIQDMYGAGARATEAAADVAIRERLGDDPADLALFRAVYALVTATCFSASGSDGHFAWCVALLLREDVRGALA